MKDRVSGEGNGYLEVTTGDGWTAVLSPGEIESIRGRSEGGTAIHTRSGRRPILLDVPISEVLAAWKGGRHATT